MRCLLQMIKECRSQMIVHYLLYILSYTKSFSAISSESNERGLYDCYTVRVLQHRRSSIRGSDTRERVLT
jgi:hypothetical protein